MDIFKQNRYLTVTIIVLVLLNLTTIALLWFGGPKHSFPERTRFGPDGREHGKNLLKEELNFTDEQADQYFSLQEEHNKSMSEFNKEIMEAKRNIFDYVLLNDPDENVLDSLVNISLKKQTQLELKTIKHFQELKKLCKPDQVKKLKEVMLKILPPPERGPEGEPPGKRPHPGMNKKQFPPPPSGDRPPKK